MSGNNLLLWMSARGSGSLRQFRRAIEELRVEAEELDIDGISSGSIWGFAGSGRLSPYVQLRLDFQSLSHAEFWENNWRVTPSTIALTRQSNLYRGVANGGRSPKLVESLQRGYPGLNININGDSTNPDSVTMMAESMSPLIEFAERNELHVQQNAATNLLVSYGQSFDRSHFSADPVPPGPEWQISRFSTQTLSWINASQQDVERAKKSLFSYNSRDETHYFISRLGRTSRITPQYGKYIVLQNLNRSLFHYDSSSQTLYVPGVCRPPLLVDRALILCSGTVPGFDRSTRLLAYPIVKPSIAKLAANVLRQSLTT